MFGWNITKKQPKLPHKSKRSVESSISHFSIQKSGYKVWFVLLLTMVLSAERKPAPGVSQSPPCGKGWGGLWANQLLTTWQDGRRALSTLHASPELPGAAGAVNRAVHKRPRTGMWLQQGARTLCFFVGYTSRAKERDRKSPIGKKRSWLSP